MAQLRIIGDPVEIKILLEKIATVVCVTDLSPGRSRRNPEHVLTYATISVLAPDAAPSIPAAHDGRRAIDR
jgi:hypothetical protein